MINAISRGLLWVLVLLVTSNVLAAEKQITVREFSLTQGALREQLVANIRFEYTLDDKLRDSLLNGVTLVNEIRFDLITHSEWWWDSKVRLDSIVTELKYHALSHNYQLLDRHSRESWNFSSLAAALAFMGTVNGHHLPSIPIEAFGNDSAIYVSAVLGPKGEGAFSITTLFSEKTELVSQGVMWPLTR
ncbi:MAG: DUF4390 domain-containing protein [Thiothrix sp.]|nr:DUF4390 domain-containing protein [Thiothrix sp.]HPQ94491.1 DUF4390 domain-containing protein [Thiolinea sp.]